MFKKLLTLLFLLNLYFWGGDCNEIEELKKLLDYKINQLKVQFESNISIINQKLESVAKNDTTSSCGSEWTPYKDTKCFKVIEKKGSETEAKTNCSQLDSSSTLISIESTEEQNFLSNLLKKYRSVSDFVWIGLEFVDNSYKWMDGKGFKFQNWDENADKDGKNKCVEMALGESSLGKWTDVSCQKKYLIACQKKQSTKTVLSQEFENITKVIEKQQKEINSMIPLGFLYTQYPNQPSPQQLWPHLKWTDVTEVYAGLFFRAEGGGSEKFGTTQLANQSWISDVLAHSFRMASWSGDSTGFDKSIPIEVEEWAHISTEDPNAWSIDHLRLFTTGGENRPRNTAIKIWKRI